MKNIFQDKFNEWTDIKFEFTKNGYDPNAVDLVLDQMMTEFQKLIEFQKHIDEKNNRLETELIDLKQENNNLREINTKLRTRITFLEDESNKKN